MPCINVSKMELRQIAARFPEEIERIAKWKEIVAKVAKYVECRPHPIRTFFTPGTAVGTKVSGSSEVTKERHGVHSVVEWSKTTRGGKHFDLLAEDEPPMCSSNYGLCE